MTYLNQHYEDTTMEIEHPDEEQYPTSYQVNHLSSPYRNPSPEDLQPEYPSTSNRHTVLPHLCEPGAPKEYHGKRYELESFLDHLNQLCNEWGVTSSEERYKAFLRFCDPKVIRELRTWPSSEYENYNTLLDELAWFHGERKAPFNITKVEGFTNKWRRKRIADLDSFKHYHLQYLGLVGEAKKARMISDWDYNRYFWEGLHPTLRRRLEAKMLASDPDLDISTPFSIDKIVKAAMYLLSPYRFDQHLHQGSEYNSSETESEPEDLPRQRRRARYSSCASDSEDDIGYFPRHRIRSPTPRPSSRKSEEMRTKKKPKGDLAAQIEQLKLAEPGCQAVCIGVIRGDQIEPLQDKPRVPFNRPPLTGGNQYQQGPPPQQHRQFPPGLPPQGPSQNRQEQYCFGCGRQGHRIGQCEEVDDLVKQGQIVRNPEGKLQWPNGSRIYRAQNETWVQAIKGASKVTNFITLKRGNVEPDTVCNYIGIPREEEDASTEDQEELGWTSGEVTERHTFAAQRGEGVSKSHRKAVQLNPPNIPHRVKKLPKHREDQSLSRPDTPVCDNINLNSHQERPPITPIPFDVHQDKFEGKDEKQLLPMHPEQEIIGNPGNNLGKSTANQRRPKVTILCNPRTDNPATDKGRESFDIAQDILKVPLTLTLQEAVGMSPALRRDLVNAVKPVREVFSQSQQKMGLAAEVTQNELEKQPPSGKTEVQTARLPAPREDLLRIPAQVGRVKTEAVFDTGSQLNIINENIVIEGNLQWEREKKNPTRVISVDGSVTECVGVIPCLNVQLTHKKLPTYGEFHIIRNPGFEILLGRKWGTMNGAGVKEEPKEGTYLSFKSNGNEYATNVCPVDKKTRGCQQVYRVEDEGQRKEVFAAKLSEFEDFQTEVPDSEEEAPEEATNWAEVNTQDIEERAKDLEYSPISMGREPPTPAQRKRKEMSEDEREDEEDQECENGPEERLSENQFCRSPSPVKRSTFRVNADLHDSYIRMVQNGVSNDEWNAFKRAETRRQERDRSRWANWHRNVRESTPDEDSFEYNPFVYRDPSPEPYRTPEPTQTLATIQVSVPQTNKKRERNPEGHGSEITATRRSKRVRRKTEKAQGEEYQNFLRSYERREKQTKKTVHSDGEPITNSDMYVLAARAEHGRQDNDPRSFFDDSDDGETIVSTETDNDYENPLPCDYFHHPATLKTKKPYVAGWTRPESVCEGRSVKGERGKEQGHIPAWVLRASGTPNALTNPSPNGPSQQESTLHKTREPEDERPDEPWEWESTRRNEKGNRIHTFARLEHKFRGPVSPSPNSHSHNGRGTKKESSKREQDKGVNKRRGADERKRTHVEGEHREQGVGRKELRKGDRPSDVAGKRNKDDIPISNQAHTDPQPSPHGRGDHIFYPGCPYNRTIPGQMNPHERGARPEPNKLRSVPGSAIPAPEFPNRPVKNEDREYEMLKAAEQLVELRNAREPEAGSCREPCEGYTDLGHQKEPGLSEYPEDAPDPLYMEYIPPPVRPPNGILAAIKLFPFARDDDTRELHFRAQGVTLATQDRDGKVVYHHGNATIRIEEPEPGTAIEVPRRWRTNEMRDRLFLKNKFVPNVNRTEIRKFPDDGRDRDLKPHLTPAEMDAFIQELINEPMGLNEISRTYTIQKKNDGVVVVRQGIDPDSGGEEPCTPQSDTNLEEQRSEGGAEESSGSEKFDQDELTQFGSDPPASDRALGCEPQGYRIIVDWGGTKIDPAVETIVRPEEDWCELEPSKINNEETPRGIKVEGQTPEKPHLNPEPQAPESVTTSPPSAGAYSCYALRVPEVTNLEQSLTASPKSRTSEPRTMNKSSKPYEVEGVHPDVVAQFARPPLHSEQTPGVLMSAHLVKLRDPTLDPHETAFFAFGATVVGSEEPGAPTYVYPGHAYIHMYNCDLSRREPTIPSEPLETEALTVATQYALFASLHREDEPTKASSPRPEPEDLKQPKIAIDPGAPQREPTNVSMSDGEGRPMTIDEALDRLRNMANDVDHPIYDTIERTDEGSNEPTSMGESSLSPQPRNQEDNNDVPLDLGKTPPHTIDPRLLERDSLHATFSTNQNPSTPKANVPAEHQFVPSSEHPTNPLTSHESPDSRTEDADSPPPLAYPDEIEPGEVVDVEARYPLPSLWTEDGKPIDVPSARVLPGLDSIRLNEESERPMITRPRASQEEVMKVLKRIKDDIGELQPGLDELQGPQQMTLCEALAEVGLLQVTFDLSHERAAGLELDPDYWRMRVSEAVNAKHDRYTYVLAQQVNKAGEPEESATHQEESPEPEPIEFTLDPPKAPLNPLPSLESFPLPDQPPTTPVAWFANIDTPPYVPISPDPLTLDDPYVPKSPVTNGELDEVRLRVSMLEDRVEATNVEYKQKLKELEAQIFVDGCTLGELKWEQAALRKLENKMKADAKKTHRWNNQENYQPRRNQTRADTTVANEKLAETRRDIGRLNDRVKKVEDRVEAAKKEMKAIEEKANKALALERKIDELAEKLEVQRKIQENTDRAILADVANLTTSVRPNLEAHLKQHEINIATLNQYYQGLYSAMVNLAYSTVGPTSPNRAPYVLSTANPIPELKKLTAF